MPVGELVEDPFSFSHQQNAIHLTRLSSAVYYPTVLNVSRCKVNEVSHINTTQHKQQLTNAPELIDMLRTWDVQLKELLHFAHGKHPGNSLLLAYGEASEWIPSIVYQLLLNGFVADGFEGGDL